MKAVATFCAMTILFCVSTTSSAQDSLKAHDDVRDAVAKQEAIERYRFNSWQKGLAPEFFTKEYPHGSPFLSNTWMNGRVELSTQLVIPHPQEILFFNYDKMRMRVMTTTPDGQLKSYSANSVLRFMLAASDLTTSPTIMSITLFRPPRAKSKNSSSATGVRWRRSSGHISTN
jgi:hypothetical protein